MSFCVPILTCQYNVGDTKYKYKIHPCVYLCMNSYVSICTYVCVYFQWAYFNVYL